MNISDQLLAAFILYGLPVLFGVIVVSSIGFPLPSSFLLIAAGSFVEQGEINLWWLILLAIIGAILGDQIGYGIGRWGGHRVVLRVEKWFGGENRLDAAIASTKKWGGFSIFFSRWLITPLGPWLNLTSGVTTFSYPQFLFWDVTGEILWVILYVMAGKMFSDRIEALTEMLGNLIWVVVGIIAAIIFGWMLFKNFRTTPLAEKTEENDALLKTSEQEVFEKLLS
jgi:membrane protein DedA with SNARE-associated domain